MISGPSGIHQLGGSNEICREATRYIAIHHCSSLLGWSSLGSNQRSSGARWNSNLLSLDVKMGTKSVKREAFYHSTEWRKCSEAFRREKHFTCEMCGKEGWLVHHKQPLTDETVDDPDIALNFDNLMLLCSSCHDAIHHRLKGKGSAKEKNVLAKFGPDGSVIVSDNDHKTVLNRPTPRSILPKK